MREMLEPVFGASGAVVAQFIITLTVVLLLIGFVYWLVRRFGGVRFNGVGRGRVPRLAIIDALSIDSRRKLVLIRRDNVEHLLLIGGTADVVVEPTILRGAPAGARPRPGQPPHQQPQRAALPAQAPPPAAQSIAPPQARPESTGISEPIPFPPAQGSPARAVRRAVEPPTGNGQPEAPLAEPVPQRRAAMRPSPMATEPLAAIAGGRPMAASAHFEEPTRPTRIESVFALADALDDIADEPGPASRAADFASPPMPSARVVEAAPRFGPEEGPDEVSGESLDLSPEPAPAIATDDALSEPSEGEAAETDSAAKVSDLEREMARLLGEITSRRES